MWLGIRRLGLQLMSEPKTQFLDALNRATRDRSFLVRIEAYRVFARDIPNSKTCSPLFGAWSDPEPWVSLEVIKLLDIRCESEKVLIAEQLKQWADDLGDESKDQHWQRPAAAQALAKFDAETAKKIAHEMAATHHVCSSERLPRAWPQLLATSNWRWITNDDEPNVRAEAINALFRLKSGKLGAAAIDALDSRNYQLIYTAAASLATARERASAGSDVLKSLGRLIEIGDDTSREARLALFRRACNSREPPTMMFRICWSRYCATQIHPWPRRRQTCSSRCRPRPVRRRRRKGPADNRGGFPPVSTLN